MWIHSDKITEWIELIISIRKVREYQIDFSMAFEAKSSSPFSECFFNQFHHILLGAAEID